MTTETLSSTDLNTVTLTQDELWQARGGTLIVSTEAMSDETDGIALSDGDVLPLANGDVVRYRAKIPDGALRPVTVVRILRSV